MEAPVSPPTHDRPPLVPAPACCVQPTDYLFACLLFPFAADTHSPGSLITGSATDVTLNAWDTPKNKRRPLITPGNSGRRRSGSNGGSAGGPAADTPDVSPLWGGRHDGASPALSAITAADISPYHEEDATLHTPGGGRRGGRHGAMDADDTRDEDMDISSAARDLREFKAGAGGARAPSSGDVGPGRSQALKSGRGEGDQRGCTFVLQVVLGGDGCVLSKISIMFDGQIQ